MKTISILEQANIYCNYYSLNGIEVDRIRFYNENGIIVSTKSLTINNEHPAVILPFEVRRANKVKFTKKDAFFVKSENKISRSRVDIYIYESLLDLKFSGEIKRELDASIEYKSLYQITVNVSNVGEKKISFYGNYRFEKNGEGKRLAEIIDAARECGLNWSEYDVKRLEAKFNLTIK